MARTRAYEPDTLVVGPVEGGVRVTPSAGDERARSFLCDITPEPENAHEVRGDERVYRFTVFGVKLQDIDVAEACRQLHLIGRGANRVMQYAVDNGQLLVWFREEQREKGYPKLDLLRKFVTAVFRAS